MNRYRFDEDGNPLMNKSVGTHPRERDYDDNLRDDYAAAIDLGLTPEEISSIEFNSCVRVGLIPASNSPADTSQPVEGICLKWTEEERGTSGHHRGLHGMGFEDSPVCVLQQGEWRWASLVMGSDGPRKDPQRLGSLDSNFEDMKSVWAGAGKEWPELGVVDSVYFSCPTLIDGKGFTILAMGHYSINRW